MTVPTTTRRRFVGTVAGVAAGAGGLASPATAQGADLGAWFENTGNADEIVDRTGKDRVTVTVGAGGNGPDGFAFGPAAVRVDPGTTIVWKWSGKGGQHNVVAVSGGFESSLYSDQGATFEHQFTEPGVYKYYCAPHKGMGMKGAVIVGDLNVSLGGASTATPTSPGTADTPAETESGEAEARSFDGWLADTSNYAGVVDKTGQDRVTVAVGAEGNGGQYAFDPPAIHVDPGTTVIWEWDSDGLSHNVRDTQGRFESEPADLSGNRFAVEFDGNGLSKYECETHSEKGMRGVVIVGDGREQQFTTAGIAAICGTGAIGGLAIVKGLQLHFKQTTTPADERGE